ncbi:hypothetical protein HVZ55_05685 [Escherichia fergusonii]|nr:hypothetical protein [Escherichia fergusonii]MBA5614270.1 hypothetical protein [Escherichia fergusonii]
MKVGLMTHATLSELALHSIQEPEIRHFLRRVQGRSAASLVINALAALCLDSPVGMVGMEWNNIGQSRIIDPFSPIAGSVRNASQEGGMTRTVSTSVKQSRRLRC